MFVDVKPRISKPPFGSVQVEWGHPLASCMTWYYPFWETGGKAIDVITNFIFSSGSHSWKPSVKGVSGVFDGTTNGFNADDLGTPYTAPYSIAALVIPSSTVGIQNIGSAGTGTAYGWQLRSDTAQWSFFQSDNVLDNLASEAGAVVIGQPAFLVGTWDGSNIRLYRDALLKATTAVTVLRNAQAIHIGYDNFGAPQRLNGQIIWLAWWNRRVLTASDIAWLFAEPYAFLQPVPVIRYWSTPPVVAAAGSVVTPRSLALLGVGA